MLSNIWINPTVSLDFRPLKTDSSRVAVDWLFSRCRRSIAARWLFEVSMQLMGTSGSLPATRTPCAGPVQFMASKTIAQHRPKG
ncbi:MAG: hypothetical protein ACJ8AI_08330 [Rhodopila sp.]